MPIDRRRDGQPARAASGCHAYLELDGEGVGAGQVGWGVADGAGAHSLLRAAFLEDGRQLVLPEPASEELIVHDLREADAGTVADPVWNGSARNFHTAVSR